MREERTLDIQVIELCDSRTEDPTCSVTYGHITREEFRERLLKSCGKEAVEFFDDEAAADEPDHQYMAAPDEDEEGLTYRFEREPFEGGQPVTVWRY
jgi:hypothetical protein